MKRPILAVFLALLCALGAAWAANAVALRDVWRATRGGSAAERLVVLPSAFWGRIEAERDMRAGRLCLKFYGFAPRSHAAYRDLLRDRLGVEMDVVGGCVATHSQRAAWEAYNNTVVAEIERRHGAGVLERTYEEAMGPTK